MNNIQKIDEYKYFKGSKYKKRNLEIQAIVLVG